MSVLIEHCMIRFQFHISLLKDSRQSQVVPASSFGYYNVIFGES